MSTVLVSGAIAGALYALIGAGLVVLYRQSNVLNFAHGAVGTLAAYVAYSMLQHGIPYAFAAGAAILTGALASLTIEVAVIRRLTGASDFTVAVAALGAGLLIIGLVTMQWGSQPVPLRPPIVTDWTVHVLGVAIGATQLLSIVITFAVFGGLYLLIERTRFGLAMRAASEGPVTASMLGINIPLVRAVSWALAGALAAVAGLLISSVYYLDPQFLTAFMITAFAAIVLGGLESIGGALAGGFVFGVVSAILAFYVTARLTDTVAFLMILIVLALFPHGLFGRHLHHVSEPLIRRRLPQIRVPRLHMPELALSPSARRVATMVVAVLLLILLAVAIAVPWLFSTVTIFELALVAAVFPAVLGQNVISGYGGQASIGQSGFMVIGAYTAALLMTNYDLPFLAILLAVVVASAIAGVVLALSAARLSGVYLALLTLSFALALPELAAFPQEITGGADGIVLTPPSMFGIDIAGTSNTYFFALAIALVSAGVVAAVARSAPGRTWKAVRDSEAGAASIGISVRRVKVYVMAIGGALCGFAGVATVVVIPYLSPESFGLWTAIYLLAAVIIGGSSSVIGAAIGAAFITLVPVHAASYPELTPIIFGVTILIVILFAPNGVAHLLRLPAARRTPRTSGAVSSLEAADDRVG